MLSWHWSHSNIQHWEENSWSEFLVNLSKVRMLSHRWSHSNIQLWEENIWSEFFCESDLIKSEKKCRVAAGSTRTSTELRRNTFSLRGGAMEAFLQDRAKATP